MIRFVRMLETGKFPVLLEVTPPREQRLNVLLRRARMLGERADAVNVIHRADRLASLDASILLREAGIDPVWHLGVRGNTPGQIREQADRARREGVRAVLSIPGDSRSAATRGAPTIREAVALLREHLPEAFLGVTLNQYADRGRVLENLAPKLRNGARFVQTQPVFSVDALTPLAEEVRSRAPGTHVVPMVMPLLSTEEADRIQKRLGIVIPEPFLRDLERGGEEVGWKLFEDTVQRLAESRVYGAITVMTLAMDPSEEFVSHIAKILDAVRSPTK